MDEGMQVRAGRGGLGRTGRGRIGRGQTGRGRTGRGRTGRGEEAGRSGRNRNEQTRPASKLDLDVISETMNEIQSIEDWLMVESRTFVCWDNAKYEKDSPKDSPASRISVQPPPNFTMPTCPTNLPPHQGPQYVRHKPGAVEVCRAALANEMISLDGVDVVANSAFLYALWGGHPGALKDRYLLQWLSADTTLFVDLIPWTTRTDVSVPGFVAERFCCQGRTYDEWHFSLAKFKIGNYTLLIVSEVDGFDPTTEKPVELTVQKKPRPPSLKELLQISLNGSTQYVQFKLSKESTTLLSSKVVQRDTLHKASKAAWTEAGRRIQCLLVLVLRDTVVRAAVHAPVQMTFEGKLPAFTPQKPNKSLFKT